MADILQYLEHEEIFYESESEISEFPSRISLNENQNNDQINCKVERLSFTS
jgi:hypothetical protein